MSESYANAADNLARAIGAAEGKSSGYHYEISHMSIDQQLKVAEICALLSIAEELSALNPRNYSGPQESAEFRS